MEQTQKEVTEIQPENVAQDIFSESIDLPSTGKFYDMNSPLIEGTIRLKFPSAKEEDILTSKNLIQKGKVIDVFLQALIVDERINMDDLLLCDKDALIIASRIMAYGPKYPIEITCPKCGEKISVDMNLAQLELKDIPELPETNLFKFTLPKCRNEIAFKLLTQKEDNIIQDEIKMFKRHVKGGNSVDRDLSTRLKYSIVSIDGNSNKSYVKEFIDTGKLLSLDSYELRNEMDRVSPGIDNTFNFICENCNYEERMVVPINVNFFWPSRRLS